MEEGETVWLRAEVLGPVTGSTPRMIARETTLPTLLHRGARKADGGFEKPTADGQHDIKLQEAVCSSICHTMYTVHCH